MNDNVIRGKFAPLEMRRSAREISTWLGQTKFPDYIQQGLNNVVEAIVHTSPGEDDDDLNVAMVYAEPPSGEYKLGFMGDDPERPAVVISYFPHLPEALSMMGFSGEAYVPRDTPSMMGWLEEHRNWLRERIGSEEDEDLIPSCYMYTLLFQAVITGRAKGVFWGETYTGIGAEGRWYLYLLEEYDEGKEEPRVAGMLIDFNSFALDFTGLRSTMGD